MSLHGKMLQHGVSLSFLIFCLMLFISTTTAANYTAADDIAYYSDNLAMFPEKYQQRVQDQCCLSEAGGRVRSMFREKFLKNDQDYTTADDIYEDYGLYSSREDLESSKCETSSCGDMFLENDQDIGHSSNNNSKDDGGGNNSKLITEIKGVILAIFGATSLIIIIKNNYCRTTTNRKMLQHKLSLSRHIFCHMLLLISTATAADYIYVECSGANFTRLTPYETNVNSLYSSLVDSASVTNFNKFEISETNAVYGLYQCREDLESSKCKDCVASSVNQLKTACPLSVGGSIQLDGCSLKYDNKPFFGVKSTVEVKKRCGPPIGYNTDILYSRDDALVNLIAGNGKYFHGGDYGSIRGVAQCVQDLSLSDCQGCLSEASGRLRSECETSSWGDMFLEKCYIRYYDRDIGYSSNNNRKDDGGGNNLKLIMEILAMVLAGLTFTCVIKCVIKNNNCCNNNVPVRAPAPAPTNSPATINS